MKELNQRGIHIKNIRRMTLLILIVLGLVACNEPTIEDEIKVFVKEYKTEQYTIDNPTHLSNVHPVEIAALFSEKAKSYLAEDEFENLMNNRFFMFAPNVAIAANKKVKLENVILNKTEVNEDGSIDYDYTLTLKYYDDQSSEIVKKEGELTIVNDVEDGLKITRDWEKPNEFEKEILSNLH